VTLTVVAVTRTERESMFYKSDEQTGMRKTDWQKRTERGTDTHRGRQSERHRETKRET